MPSRLIIDCWVDNESIYIREWFKTSELRPQNILSIEDGKQIMTYITFKKNQSRKQTRVILNKFENASEVLLKIKNYQ